MAHHENGREDVEGDRLTKNDRLSASTKGTVTNKSKKKHRPSI